MRGKVKLISSVLVFVSIALIAETKKEFRFTVGPNARVSVFNDYGPVSVKPSDGNQVIITATVHSDKVQLEQKQSGNRVQVSSRLLDGATPESGRVDYEVVVPSDANITIESSRGELRAEGLHGDVTVEGADSAPIDIRNVSNAHVHINAMNSAVKLSNIQNGHVEINSVRGDVLMNAVNGPKVDVNSTTGKIIYAGDFGSGGTYSFSTHTGDIEATIPDQASFDLTANSLRGNFQNDGVPLHSNGQKSAAIPSNGFFRGVIGKAASAVSMRTVRGTIHLKKQ